MSTKTVSVEDFKVGAVFTNEYGNWTLLNKYDEGIWEARGKSGTKCIFEGEARFYSMNY